jgi:wyosine [tRNA(Phe)-imidazoG37] synthetase (radical SAM superfamily)
MRSIEDKESKMLTFGPVPSRRLGRSLGINNITFKDCSYSCVYCQIGRTTEYSVERRDFYPPERIYNDVLKSVKSAGKRGEKIDYLTFVADGEPTLDINLIKILNMIKTLGIKTAIISNSSLIWMDEVKRDLMNFDWVSLKCDSVDEHVWKKIDRPHEELALKKILNGIVDFSHNYKGDLNIEVMLVRGVNDGGDNLKQLGYFLRRVKYNRIYLSVPTRPPAEKFVDKPDEMTVIKAYNILGEKLKNVQLNIGFEGNEFSSTGDLENDILRITAVHPMKIDSVINLINREKGTLSIINKLKKEEKIKEIDYNGEKFIVRTLY